MNRKKHHLLNSTLPLLMALALTLPMTTKAQSKAAMKKLIDRDLGLAVSQYKLLIKNTPDGVLPKTFDSTSRTVKTSNARSWTSGFVPGTLWYLYEYQKDPALKKDAETRMNLLADQQYYTGTHDLGFMLYCSYGNAYRITGDTAYKQVLLNAAHSLSTRFNPTVGCIKSWDHGTWTYPVIIDNMMNLELLCWAAQAAPDKRYLEIAETHANTTLKNHFRPDYSSFHVVDYDPQTGKILAKKTAQGYADWSAWARGQAWALYGYTMMYRETKDPRYLSQAEHVAGFILDNPHLPGDLIPYWDFNAPDIPHADRDASAGAIMASALLELSTFTKNKSAQKRYLSSAKKMLVSLSSPAYLSRPGQNGGFLLMHSVGSLPGNAEVDVPLTYADYYFVEALLRYRNWILPKS